MWIEVDCPRKQAGFNLETSIKWRYDKPMVASDGATQLPVINLILEVMASEFRSPRTKPILFLSV